MPAKILSVGDELTSGQTTDTNSAYISRQLGGKGIGVSEHRTVPDDERAIREAILDMVAACDLLVITGGLGPTDDDLTRHALAGAMGVELRTDDESLRRIADRFAGRGWLMAENNKRQALVPDGAEAIANERGTAPGIAAKLGRCDLYVLPGPPGEMRWMLDEQVLRRLPEGRAAIVHLAVHTFGMGESSVAALIADLMARGLNPSVGTTASAGMVTVRVTSRGANAAEAHDQAGAVLAELRTRLGQAIVGTDDTTMPVALGQLLKASGRTLATAESCTGGLLAKLMTDVPGSSAYFLGAVVAYANRAKRALLSVPSEVLETHGAVSEPVASAMAEGARAALGSDYALSTTGVAGPAGGTDDKPVGTVCIALACPDGTEARTVRLTGDRQAVRLRAALAAMDMLRLKLLRA
jgi:nicotinamide-nucleotide amidase